MTYAGGMASGSESDREAWPPAPTFSGIAHVQVAAPPGCEPAARHFFGAILGLAELQKPEPAASRGGAWFNCGAQQVHVGVEADFRPAKKAHAALALPDRLSVMMLRRRLATAGCPVIESGDGDSADRFFAHDPWGNRIEFTTLS